MRGDKMVRCVECHYFIIRDGYDFCKYHNKRVDDLDGCTLVNLDDKHCTDCVYYILGECVLKSGRNEYKCCEYFIKDTMMVCDDCNHKRVCKIIHSKLKCGWYNGDKG